MDFPRNTTTNVHKIEGVLFIQWSVYGLEQDTLPKADNNGMLLEYPTDALLTAEHDLRRTGHHVFYEEPQGILWVFDLSGPNVKKDPRSDHQRGASSAVERHSLKRLLFGSLRASDLVDVSTPAQRLTDPSLSQLHSWLYPASQDGETRIHPGRSANISQDNVSIYNKIISAILMSLSYFLAKSSRYTPLSATIFLHKTPPLFQPVTAGGFDSFRHAIYQASCLEVQWLSCGSLIILSYPKQGGSWCCLGDSHIQPPIPQRSTVVLAPFGVTASRCFSDADELLEQSFGEDNNRNIGPGEWSARHGSFKLKIVSLLKRRGVEISDDCSWVSISIPMSHRSTGGDPDRVSANIMQWPAQLCFRNGELDKVDGHGSAFIWQGLLDSNTDPLRDAETWFRERHDRKKKIDRRRLELKILSEQEAQASLLKEEDIRSGLFSGIERHNETQGLTGIYPTPPDGFRSQPGHPTELDGSDPANRQEDTEMHDQGEDNNKTTNEDGTPLNPLHGVGMSLGAYDDIDDELFGNMDSAMFTANGITEDDFSFFDEPKAPPTIVPASMAPPVDTQNTYTAELTPDNTFETLPKVEEDDMMLVDEYPSQSLDGYYPYNQAHDAQQRTDASVENDTLHTNSSRQVSFQLPDASSPATGQDRGNDDLVGNSPLWSDIKNEEILVDQRRSAFASLSLKNLPQIVDQKYAGQGRFFVEHDQIDAPFRPEADKVEKSVPTLGFGIGQDDDFDSDTEETYTSNTSSPPDETSQYPAASVDASNPSSARLIPQSDDKITKQFGQVSTDFSMTDPFLSPNESQAADTKTVSPLMLQMSDSPLVYMANNRELSWGAAGLSNGLYTGHNEDFIQVAQIVADQLAVLSSTLETSSLERASSSKQSQYDDPLASIIPALFPRSETCILEACASTGETHRGVIAPPKAVIRPLQRRVDSIRGSVDHAPSSAFIFNIDTPNVRVLRGDTLMELSATGLQFWEELGLSPCLGPKNITGYCVYPNTEMIHRGVASFMNLMSMTYQSLRLGTHQWGHEKLSDFSEGFASVPLSNDSIVISPSSIDTVCERLGEVLVDSKLSDQAVVIYVVNPFTKSTFLPRLCESFLRCLKKFESDIDPIEHGDVVLKVLPISWVASRTTIPLPSPKEYAALAKNVYDRCPATPASRNSSPFASTSLLQLAEAIPKTLDFRLTANPISSLSRKNSALHVGYSWPRDSQWLCVSVVDNLASLQWNASYCFGTALSDPWPTFREIAEEIWRGILDMIDEPQAKRFIYLIKDELLAQEEIDAWKSLCPPADQAQPLTPSPSYPSLTLILLAAEISPPIHASTRPPFPTTDDPLLSTPASTPLAPPTPTPDLASPGFPPSALKPLDASTYDTDPSARLIDPSDETWGLIAPRCFTTANFCIPTGQAVGSGYLIKRAGRVDEEGWELMGVHVLSAEKWGEGSMRELLGVYRSFGTVARGRGVGRGVLPVHLAWVGRVGRGLRGAMGYVPPPG